MNLTEEILKEHSKSKCEMIVSWVGNSQNRFDELFNIFIQKESKLTQRASWPLSYCVQKHPALIHNKFDKLIKKLHEPCLHDAIKRNSVRMLQYVSIPEKHQGAIMDICFKYLESPKEAVATKANSLYVLANLAKQYPEISAEINLLIEDQLPNQTSGFKTAVKRMKELKN